MNKLHVIMIDNAKLKDKNLLNENRKSIEDEKSDLKDFLAIYLVKGGERLPSYILVFVFHTCISYFIWLGVQKSKF